MPNFRLYKGDEPGQESPPAPVPVDWIELARLVPKSSPRIDCGFLELQTFKTRERYLQLNFYAEKLAEQRIAHMNELKKANLSRFRSLIEIAEGGDTGVRRRLLEKAPPDYIPPEITNTSKVVIGYVESMLNSAKGINEDIRGGYELPDVDAVGHEIGFELKEDIVFVRTHVLEAIRETFLLLTPYDFEIEPTERMVIVE